MAEDLRIAESVFSTEMMQPEADEFLSAAWAEYLAYNTGWLAYRGATLPQHACTMGSGSSPSVTRRVYITEGTWVGHGFVSYTPGAMVGVAYKIDGTTIVTGGGAGATYGSGTFIMAASGWATVTVTTTLPSTDAGTLAAAAYFVPCRL
jgi:hypothetical protein